MKSTKIMSTIVMMSSVCSLMSCKPTNHLEITKEEVKRDQPSEGVIQIKDKEALQKLLTEKVEAAGATTEEEVLAVIQGLVESSMVEVESDLIFSEYTTDKIEPDLRIVIRDDGSIFQNDPKIELHEKSLKLLAKELGDNPIVEIAADSQVKAKIVMDVMNILSQEGITRIYLR